MYLYTPFQNQGARTGRKVAEGFGPIVPQKLHLRLLMKFTYRLNWVGYLEINFRAILGLKMMIFEKLKIFKVNFQTLPDNLAQF